MTEFKSDEKEDKTLACAIAKEVRGNTPFTYGEVYCPSCDDGYAFDDMKHIGGSVYKCPNCGYIATIKKEE
jgi:hypothetical protein